MKQRKILVIDDDPECILLIKEIFATSSLQILHSLHGSCGLNKLTQHPDTELVLLDIRLPDTDGFQVFEKIKKMNELVNVIGMTADVTNEMIEKCKMTGFDEYVTKPFDIHSLKSKVRIILRDLL